MNIESGGRSGSLCMKFGICSGGGGAGQRGRARPLRLMRRTGQPQTPPVVSGPVWMLGQINSTNWTQHAGKVVVGKSLKLSFYNASHVGNASGQWKDTFNY